MKLFRFCFHCGKWIKRKEPLIEKYKYFSGYEGEGSWYKINLHAWCFEILNKKEGLNLKDEHPDKVRKRNFLNDINKAKEKYMKEVST